MRRFMVGAWVVAAVALFSGCGPGGDSGPAQISRHPTRLPNEPPPAEIEHPEELPPGWYIEPGHERGLMLKNADLDDRWVWIAIEWSVRGPDLQKALEVHRKNFE